ncbi:hypothetical protein HUN58_11945 [Curtobacterium sp. Csp1]|nr:hypothetical protein [Curtobacterium sp. Csp1]QKS18481.1 hypothetical protein HUN58_11945 [Curtobacterium sp. Csp1]
MLEPVERGDGEREPAAALLVDVRHRHRGQVDVRRLPVVGEHREELAVGRQELDRVAAALDPVGALGVLDDVRGDLGQRGLEREAEPHVVDVERLPPGGEPVLHLVEGRGDGRHLEGHVLRGHSGPPAVEDSCSDCTVPGPGPP